MRPGPHLTGFLIFMLLICGCSGAGGITAPDGAGQASPGLQPDRLTDTVASHQLLGFYLCHTDPATRTIRIVPVRLADMHLNVLRFLEQSPCTDCLTAELVGLSPHGSLLVDITISHPFPIANLTAFDIRGIMMFNGGFPFPATGLTVADNNAGDGSLLDAEGYTALYNVSSIGQDPGGLQSYIPGRLSIGPVSDALLNGYKRFISDDPANTRNAFYAGDSVTVQYDIALPSMPGSFGYAIDASWAKPTTKPVTDPMTDFPPDANCPEPWMIEVTEDSGGGPGLTDAGGETALIIDVYDWSGSGSHALPVIECPQVFDGTLTADWTEDAIGYSRYEVTLENSMLVPAGEYRCLIGVEDNENATSPEWLDLSAYQIVLLEVTEYVNQPPVAAAHSNKNVVLPGETVYFFDDSTDPDGNEDIIAWQWDFTWVSTCGFQIESTEQNPTWSYPYPGTFRVHLQVTDTVSNVDLLDETLTITVEANFPPTAMAHADKTEATPSETISFFDDSTDPEGPEDIVKWEWDFSYDELDGFQVESSEQNPTHEYAEIGTYEVLLRISDTAENEDTLDDPIVITISE